MGINPACRFSATLVVSCSTRGRVQLLLLFSAPTKLSGWQASRIASCMYLGVGVGVGGPFHTAILADNQYIMYQSRLTA